MSENQNGFDPVKGILYTRSNGITHLEDMLKGINSLAANNLLPRKLKIIEDALEAITTFSAREISIITKRLEEVLIEYTSIRHAVVHIDPKNTALSILIAMKVNNPKYCLATFSTMKAAQEWILSDNPA